MAFSGSQITRLGLSGISRALYGSFAGKAEKVITADPIFGGQVVWDKEKKPPKDATLWPGVKKPEVVEAIQDEPEEAISEVIDGRVVHKAKPVDREAAQALASGLVEKEAYDLAEFNEAGERLLIALEAEQVQKLEAAAIEEEWMELEEAFALFLLLDS